MKYHRREFRVQSDNAQQGPKLGSLRPYKPWARELDNSISSEREKASDASISEHLMFAFDGHCPTVNQFPSLLLASHPGTGIEKTHGP